MWGGTCVSDVALLSTTPSMCCFASSNSCTTRCKRSNALSLHRLYPTASSLPRCAAPLLVQRIQRYWTTTATIGPHCPPTCAHPTLHLHTFHPSLIGGCVRVPLLSYSRAEAAVKTEEGEECTVTTLLLDRICTTLHQAMTLLHLPASPLSALSSFTPSPTSSRSRLALPAPTLLPPQAAFLTSMAHNLALLSSSLLLYSHALYLTHYAITLSPSHLSSTRSPLPYRNLRLFLLALLTELAHRARPLAQGQYGDCVVRVAGQVKEADARGEGVRGDQMPSVLELQGRVYALSGKARYVAKQGQVSDDVSEETFDVEQRLTALLASRRWGEKHCELILFTALHIRPPQRSLALLVLHHLLSAFPSPAGIRHQLLCTLADDGEWFVHCTSLLSDSVVVGFAALRFVTEDCWTRGVLAVRRAQWDEGERMMRLALQLLHRSRQCTDRPVSDDDEAAVTAMELQLSVVRARAVQRKRREGGTADGVRRDGKRQPKQPR